jgi:hypothetical protein
VVFNTVARQKDRCIAQKTGLKDFVLLYYSIIKDQMYNKQDLRPEVSLQEKLENSTQHASFYHLKMVEVNGIEPMASCVQGRRSPS